MSVFGSAFITPIIAGKLSVTMGWEWTFYFVAIFSGLLFPLCFFCCPETAFVRPDVFNTDIGIHEQDQTGLSAEHELSQKSGTSESKDPEQPEIRSFPSSSSPSPTPPTEKTSYLKSLHLFNGRKTDEPFLKLFFRPFPLFLNPGIIWACLTQGTLIGFTVLIGIVLATIMLSPPLLFWSDKVGYMYTSALIGALVGFIFCGLVSDWSAKWLTKKNGGVYEPEFRVSDAH